jgi:outer membrane murein-binding lipoprotein Lpp
MNRRLLLAALALIPFALSGCASTGMVDDSKIGKLATSLGLTTEQAQAGVGSMLSLAENRLDPAEYAKISAVVPRGNEFMALANRLGAFQGSVGNAAGLNSAFAKLGISPEQAAKLVPTVSDYVSKAAGPGVGLAFANAMK